MGFKTYTCCICGKEGLTKPQSYAIEGKGRACREHQEAQDANKTREKTITQKREQSRKSNKNTWELAQEQSMRFLNVMYQCAEKKCYVHDPKTCDRDAVYHLYEFLETLQLHQDQCCFSSIISQSHFIPSGQPNCQYIVKRFIDTIIPIAKSTKHDTCIDVCKSEALKNEIAMTTFRARCTLDQFDATDPSRICKELDQCMQRLLDGIAQVHRMLDETVDATSAFALDDQLHEVIWQIRIGDSLHNWYLETGHIPEQYESRFTECWQHMIKPYLRFHYDIRYTDFESGAAIKEAFKGVLDTAKTAYDEFCTVTHSEYKK